jgi:hypothetical protein
MTRCKLLYGSLTAIIAVPILAYLVLAPRVTAANYQQIHDGMTLADLESLLGPPAERSKIPVYWLLCTNAGMLREEYGEEADEEVHWQDGGGRILVGFNGTVVYKRFDPGQDESPLDKFHRWFGTARRAVGW